MKNTNITLHTTQKKEYVLTGILSLPLHLGERAWIYSYNQTFATSPCAEYSGSIRKRCGI